MSKIWPSSDLFELMEGLDIIETHGKMVRLRPEFKDFVKGLDSQMVNLVIADMISDGIIPAPKSKEIGRIYFFWVAVTLWDSSLPDDETEAAAIFLASFSWGLEMGILTSLKDGGR